MTPRDRGGFVVRVVYVPAGAGASDARRRVVDVLLRAPAAPADPIEGAAPETPANGPMQSPSRNAA